MSQQPYDFGQARQAAAAASRLQQSAEDFIKESSKDMALKEEAYRLALAEKIVELRASGEAVTLAKDLARGDKDVARKKRESMIAEGVKEAAVQAAWRRAHDAKYTDRFIDWSMRREMAEGYGKSPDPKFDSPIGGRK